MEISKIRATPEKLNVMFIFRLIYIPFLFLYLSADAQPHLFNTKYLTIGVSNSGYIVSLKDKQTKKEYCPPGDSSALISLYKDKNYILPVSARFNRVNHQISLHYSNGSVATISAMQKPGYFAFKLISLVPRNGVDNIVWGPYKTSISQNLGEIISVVRNDEFSLGIMALDNATSSGPPSEGDLPQSYYLIHAPPGVKLPPNLHEGQIFNTGGDSLGTSDVAFYSQPEEYYRFMTGNGAMLRPYGSDIVLHARDRRIPQVIDFRPFRMSPGRHQYVTPIDVDFIGSRIAFFGCPEPATLDVIEKIELGEGLPHPTIEGKWIKRPTAAKPFIAWFGAHDSLVAYAGQLGFKAVQDEALGEYYYNPANRWDNKKVNFSNGSMSIKEYTAITNKAGIAYGLHTLCEFIQPYSSDVTPVPNDSLCKVGSTVISAGISAYDSVITIADPTFFRESGGWEDTRTNVLQLGKELISYEGVSATKPYTLIHPLRGWDKTRVSAHRENDTIYKLMPNAYHGFAPDIYLQDKYAIAYASLLNDGAMDYIDFDGLESCWYQGQGQYSIRRFYDTLFRHLNHYIRNTGSCVFEGNWHYQSSLDVGGNLFNPVSNEFNIEGKDVREMDFDNLLHVSFGLVYFSPRWNSATAENLEARAIGWDGQYMLGLSQRDVEKCGEKSGIFKAIRTWENAREANVFSKKQKKALQVLANRFHLEQTAPKKWKLYPVKNLDARITDMSNPDSTHFNISNPFSGQPLQFRMEAKGAKGSSLAGLTLQLNHGKTLKLNAGIRAGQSLVCDGHGLYITDENWNKISNVDMPDIPLLASGANEITVGAGSSNDPSFSLSFLFSVRGIPEQLGY
ncbi:MAG: hypothetical protein Q8918_17930 [Bacteroidota bacterium]|nr:hypothetical protein [Bacteroidota bacterium]